MSQPGFEPPVSDAEQLLEQYAAGKREFAEADLKGAHLSQVTLRGANLSYADLESANLSFADLRGVDLSYANLNQTNLIQADLRGAIVRDGGESPGRSVDQYQPGESRLR
jgi:uncharacterized protein YjbI with pentapeptide repeats